MKIIYMFLKKMKINIYYKFVGAKGVLTLMVFTKTKGDVFSNARKCRRSRDKY